MAEIIDLNFSHLIFLQEGQDSQTLTWAAQPARKLVFLKLHQQAQIADSGRDLWEPQFLFSNKLPLPHLITHGVLSIFWVSSQILWGQIEWEDSTTMTREFCNTNFDVFYFYFHIYSKLIFHSLVDQCAL